jgi:hypothetical protein
MYPEARYNTDRGFDFFGHPFVENRNSTSQRTIEELLWRDNLDRSRSGNHVCFYVGG